VHPQLKVAKQFLGFQETKFKYHVTVGQYSLHISNNRVISKKIMAHERNCQVEVVKLGEEHRLKVFENSMLRRIFWPKSDEII
jgi:hypothetical protein